MTDFVSWKAPDLRPKKEFNKHWLFISIPLWIIVLGMLFNSCMSGSDDDAYDMNTKYEAAAQCEARIEKLLKAPSTAKFDSTATGSRTWTVTGTVDAENNFGAMIRANYQCTVVMNADGETATTTVDSFDG